MLKLLAIPLLLLTALFAPIAPTPAILHFAPGLPVEQAVALTDDLAGEQIATTFIDDKTGQRWYGARLWDNRHGLAYHPGETVTKIYLTQLSPADQSRLEQTKLVQSIELAPPYLANLTFFFRQAQKITGHR